MQLVGLILILTFGIAALGIVAWAIGSGKWIVLMLLLFCGGIAWLARSLFQQNDEGSRYSVDVTMPAVIRERVMTLTKNGKAGLRLVPDGIEPLLPRRVRDKGPWLNFVFIIPPYVRRHAVALEFFDDVVQFRITPDHSDLPGDHLEATVSPYDAVATKNDLPLLGGRGASVPTDQAPTTPPVAGIPGSLAGKYIAFGGSASWTGGGTCINDQFAPGPATADSEAKAMIELTNDNRMFLTMEDVGGRQLPRLRYVMRPLESSSTSAVYETTSDTAPWSVMCGSSATTVPASASGRLKFELVSGAVIKLTGSIIYSGSLPQCAGYTCPVTFRDIYSFDHVKH